MKKEVKWALGIICSLLFTLGVVSAEFVGNTSNSMDVPIPIMILQIPFLVAIIFVTVDFYGQTDWGGQQGYHVLHTVLGMLTVAYCLHVYYPMTIPNHDGFIGYSFGKSEGAYGMIFAISATVAYFALWLPVAIMRDFFKSEDNRVKLAGEEPKKSMVVHIQQDNEEARKKFLLKVGAMNETELRADLAEAIRNEWYKRAQIVRDELAKRFEDK